MRFQVFQAVDLGPNRLVTGQIDKNLAVFTLR